MRLGLLVLSVLIGFGGVHAFRVSETIFHEIAALVIFLIAAVFMVGAAIVDAVNSLQSEVGESAIQCRYPEGPQPEPSWLSPVRPITPTYPSPPSAVTPPPIVR